MLLNKDTELNKPEQAHKTQTELASIGCSVGKGSVLSDDSWLHALLTYKITYVPWIEVSKAGSHLLQ